MRWHLRIVAALVAAMALGGLILSAHRYRHARQIYEQFQAGSEEAYTRLMQDPSWRTRALYNLANRYLQEAVRDRRADRLRMALAYYRQVLREDPTWVEAKKNYELASRMQAQQAQDTDARDGASRTLGEPGQLPGMEAWALDI